MLSWWRSSWWVDAGAVASGCADGVISAASGGCECCTTTSVMRAARLRRACTGSDVDYCPLHMGAPTALIRPWRLRLDGSCSRVLLVGHGEWDRGKPLASSRHGEASPLSWSRSPSWRPRRDPLLPPSSSLLLAVKVLVPLVGGDGVSTSFPPWRRRLGFTEVWMVLFFLLRAMWRRLVQCYSSSPRGLRLLVAIFSLRLDVWLPRWW